MAETFANFTAYTTLAIACDSDDTALTVADASGLDTGGNLRLRIGDELLLVTAVVGNVLTVTRGIESTTAAAHDSGDDVWPVLTAAGLGQALSEVDAGIPIGYLDTDGALTANSDTKVPSQQAIKEYVDAVAATKAATTYVDAADTALSSAIALKASTTYVDAADAALSSAIALKAPLASPALTGNPTAPTQSQGNNSTRIATTEYVDTGLAALIAAADAMVFKGVIDCSANPNYPAADRGHTYRVSVTGKIGGASGVNVEAGDLLLCLTDSTASGNQATVGTSWSIIQTNLDGAVIGPASAVDSKVALFDGTSGKLLKDSGLSLAGNNTGDQSSIVGITGTLAEFNTALTGADFATGGGTASGTNTGDQDLSSLVVGPASSTSGGFPRWNGTTGKLLANGSVVNLTSEVTGALPVGNGGTGMSVTALYGQSLGSIVSGVIQYQTDHVLGEIEDIIVSNNATDALHDLDFTAGRVLSNDALPANRVWITLSAITKRFDATWAVGSGNGGLDTGALAANSWYGVWAIMRVDTNVTDIVAVLGNGSPSMPANYTKKALLFDFLTDSGSNILAFINYRDFVLFTTPITNLSTTTPATSSSLLATSTPARSVIWIGNQEVTDNSGALSIASIGHGITTSGNDVLQTKVPALSSVTYSNCAAITDTSGRIRYFASAAGWSAYIISTNGFQYFRKRI